MEEKRKLERLLISDIEAALARQDASSRSARERLIQRLQAKPPAEVRKLFEKYTLATNTRQDVKKKLAPLGYDISYQDALTVASYQRRPAELDEFDARAQEKRKALLDLQRSYVIRLFADHADTQGLFASLTKDLERLLG